MLVEHVCVKGTEEETGGGAVVRDPDAACIARAGEVRLDDAQRAARRRIAGLAIERQENLGRALVHVHGDDGRDDAGEERNELVRELAQHDSRVFVAGQRLQVVDRRRQFDVARFHRLEEELLLRLDVPEERGRRDVQLLRDVGQGGRFEALPREHAARRREQLGALDRSRAAHL